MPPKGKSKHIEPSTRRLSSEGSVESSGPRGLTGISQDSSRIIEAARRHSAAADCEAAYAQIEKINESISEREIPRGNPTELT